MKIAPVADVKARFSVLAHTPRFLALLDAAHDRIKKGGGVRHEDFWKAAEKKDRRTSR